MQFRKAQLSSMLLILLACLTVSCAKSEKSAHYGYALLYNVTSQQQDVDKLLWIKDPSASVSEWIKRIAAFNKEVTQQLDAWKTAGRINNLSEMGLPPTEMAARERAKSGTTGDLLLGTGDELSVELVVTQLKAMGYCADLCYALAKESKIDSQKKKLEAWQKQFAKLNADGLKLLETE